MYMYVDIQSVGCMLHMYVYVVYREQSVGSQHKHSSEMEIETFSTKCKFLLFLKPTCTRAVATGLKVMRPCANNN